MAFLYLESTNPEFNKIIMKRPETPLTAKPVKKGVLYGYYSKDNIQRYNIYFEDGSDEMSFSNNDFEYVDGTRYDSPMFIISAIQEMLHSAFNKVSEFDTDQYEHKITFNSVNVKRAQVTLDRLFSHLSDFKIVYDKINDMDYKISISTNKSLYSLINMAYIYGFMQIINNRLEYPISDSQVERTVKAANIINAPYFVRYLLKAYLIPGKTIFDKVMNDLNNVPGHDVKFVYEMNQASRINNIRNVMPPDINIVDFGCGEGTYFNLSKNIPNNRYIAIDKDEVVREAAQHIIKKKQIENIDLYSSLDDVELSEPYFAMLNEVIEHNTIFDATQIVSKFSNDSNCKKIVMTTPNRAFNINYMMTETEMRHDDHIFEFTYNEFKNFIYNNIDINIWDIQFTQIGDIVDGESTTSGVILTRKD